MTETKVEPVSDPGYWAARLRAAQASDNLHHAVFRCPAERWARIGAKHREVLAATLHIDDRVLDAGCGYGDLLDLMPDWWRGAYVGMDLSRELLDEAKRRHPQRVFLCGDLQKLTHELNIAVAHQFLGKFDWAVCRSMRPMIKRNLGDAAWAEMEAGLRRMARKLLFLEYDESDLGSVE
jgi:SAM-dependent methyltransferase